jgi:hypothetical protein
VTKSCRRPASVPRIGYRIAIVVDERNREMQLGVKVGSGSCVGDWRYHRPLPRCALLFAMECSAVV